MHLGRVLQSRLFPFLIPRLPRLALFPTRIYPLLRLALSQSRLGDALRPSALLKLGALRRLCLRPRLAHASRAFDKERDGFVIAAGGGIVVLEELEHAKKRGARIYAEVVGYSATSDGYDMVAPSGEGGQRCMREAIAMANKIGGDKPVDYVNTHGTSTPVGDVKELGAIQGLFDEEFDYFPKVGSTKSLSGHALSVAGVHEAIYSLLMICLLYTSPSPRDRG